MERSITTSELDEEVRVLAETHPSPATFEESNRTVTELEINYPAGEFTVVKIWESNEWQLVIGAFGRGAESRGTRVFSRRPDSDRLIRHDDSIAGRNAGPRDTQRAFFALSAAIESVQQS